MEPRSQQEPDVAPEHDVPCVAVFAPALILLACASSPAPSYDPRFPTTYGASGRPDLESATRRDLVHLARRRDLPGRSTMTRDELLEALRADS